VAQTQFGRFDKYDGMVGGFRAPLNANMSQTGDDIGKVQAVSINTSGRVVIGGAAETAIIGVIVPVKIMNAGDIVDVAQNCEIVDCVKTGGTAWAAGDIVYAHGTTGGVGVVDAASANGKVIGKIVDAPAASGLKARMVVRCPIATT
jgi:hypothetical protein